MENVPDLNKRITLFREFEFGNFEEVLEVFKGIDYIYLLFKLIEIKLFREKDLLLPIKR